TTAFPQTISSAGALGGHRGASRRAKSKKQGSRPPCFLFFSIFSLPRKFFRDKMVLSTGFGEKEDFSCINSAI
ncbi:MAG: hypothetical protein IKN53_05500, partial [Oscillibacter sp.]|nr:hypothetical protein [Oscillibacter sp.]